MKYTLLMGALFFALAQPAFAAENDDLLTHTAQKPAITVDTEYEVDDSVELSLDQEIEKMVGKGTGEAHKSEVAKAVADLLDTAELDRGIGDQVRMLAKEQAEVHERVAEKMDHVLARGEWETFFWGPDYKSLGDLRSDLITSENGLDVLRKAKEKAHVTLQDDIDTQIAALEAENAHARAFIEEHEDVFSLFGWFAKFF